MASRELEQITHGRDRDRKGLGENVAEADVLSYDQDEFGMPRNVYLNGRRLHAVQGIELSTLYGEDFSEVTIKLKGTYVSVNATPKESSAQDG